MWNPLVMGGISASLAVAGAVAGVLLARTKRAWLAGFLVPLAFVVMILLSRRIPLLEFRWPFRWIMAGRTEFLVLASASSMMLVTLISRLRQRRLRILLGIFSVIFVLDGAVLPFVLPLVMRGQLRRVNTVIDADGVCLQQTGYTCGPAAAVTALRRLDLPADEGELAIYLQASPTGTQADILAELLARRFGSSGLTVEYRAFRSADELPADGQVLAVVTANLLCDHFVVVDRVTPTEVEVSDPLRGKSRWTRAAFDARWRGSGVVLRRTRPDG
ncbi:MAG: cysteine peptidase family C39 domain-containing protein [Tepidisphaerales bacterium]